MTRTITFNLPKITRSESLKHFEQDVLPNLPKKTLISLQKEIEQLINTADSRLAHMKTKPPRK